MGVDATAVIERNTKMGWETIGIISLPRHYDLFEDITEEGTMGYPSDMCTISKLVLDALEDYGETHMSYEDFLRLLKKYSLGDLNTVKKKLVPSCRVICMFDR